MRKIFTLILLSLCAMLGLSQTIHVDMNHGRFTKSNPQKTWAAEWTSNATDPGLTLTVGANNMGFEGIALKIFSGMTNEYSINAQAGWLIESVEFDFRNDNKQHTTLAVDGGKTYTCDGAEKVHVSIPNVDNQIQKFVVDEIANRAFIIVSDFTVVLKKDNNYEAPTYVFKNANSSVPYRIPGIAQTKSGKLLAVADYRHCKRDIGNGAIDLVISESEDNGENWTEPRIFAEHDDAKASGNQWDYAFGDPSIVADRESDEVLVMAVGGHVGYFQSSRQNPQHVVRFRSHDGGETWDGGTNITEDIYGLYDGREGGSPAGIFLTSGRIMQSKYVKVGAYYRLYIAHPLRGGGDGAYVIYSDDFGETWKVLGGAETVPCSGRDESKVEELPDGSVLLSTRVQGGGRQYNVFTYTDADKAEGVWGKEVIPKNMTGNQVNACNGSVLVVPVIRKADGEKVFLILQTVPLSRSRQNVGFYYKELVNGNNYNTAAALGADWVKGKQLTAASSCYSSMVLKKDHKVGILFEVNQYNGGYDIEYRDLTIDDITNDAYKIDETGGDRAPFMDINYNARFLEAFSPYFETAGNYFSISTEGKEALQADYDRLSEKCGVEDIKTFGEAMAKYVQTPKDGYYRMYCNLPYGDRYPDPKVYLGAGMRGYLEGMVPSATGEGANTVVYLEKDAAGNYSIQLEGYNVQSVAYAKETAPAHLGETVAWFEPRTMINAPGKAAFYSVDQPHDSNRDCIHVASKNTNHYKIVAWTADAAASHWVVEDATDYHVGMVTVGEYAMATLHVPFATQVLTKDVKACIGKIEEQEGRYYIALEEVKGVIPANTGVVLISPNTDLSDVLLAVDAKGEEAKVEGNIFSGVNAASVNDNSANLFFDALDGKGGFKMMAGKTKIEPNTVYVGTEENTSGAAELAFDEKTVGINEVLNQISAPTIYDLNGRAVKKVERGVMIINGKKVLIHK